MFYVTLDCAGFKEVDDSRKTVLPKCSSNLDHVLLRRWTREAGTLILSSRPSLGSAPIAIRSGEAEPRGQADRLDGDHSDIVETQR